MKLMIAVIGKRHTAFVDWARRQLDWVDPVGCELRHNKCTLVIGDLHYKFVSRAEDAAGFEFIATIYLYDAHDLPARDWDEIDYVVNASRRRLLVAR